MQGELKTLQHTWGIIQKLAQNRQEWWSFVAALHTWRYSWAWVSEWVSEWVSDSVSVTRVSIRWKRKSRNCTSPANTVPPIFNCFWKLYPPPSPVYIINQRRFVCNQKFPRFLEISEIPRSQKNGTLRRNSRYCTVRLVIILVSRIQKSGTRYNNLAYGKEPSRTDQIRPSSKMFPNIPVGPNRNDPFHLFSNRNFRNFGLNGKRPTVLYDDLWSHVTGSGSLLRELNLLKHWFSFVTINEVRSWWSPKHELPFTTNFHFNSIPYLFY